ncbi:vitamin K epoxide reductase family protein [Rubrolithibacter danxiaensis]|uniref:vitamin K epoxide reductase family protein n=1 Tax=Rubrolithibacter danxiaensis TaxID=3390805 RepID=UPI003BF7C60B
MELSHQIPPGWNYNPSSWNQRLPLVLVALAGFFVAFYLASYQLNFISTVWDPFFGKGTEKVLTSPISELLPVPDALLGAFGYVLDAVSGLIGKTGRWKTMPWIVLLFGFAVGPLGIVSILLVIAQPVFLGSWCTLCLVSAALSIIMIGPAMDEILASLQYLQRVKINGFSVWKAFWGNKEIVSKVI